MVVEGDRASPRESRFLFIGRSRRHTDKEEHIQFTTLQLHYSNLRNVLSGLFLATDRGRFLAAYSVLLLNFLFLNHGQKKACNRWTRRKSRTVRRHSTSKSIQNNRGGFTERRTVIWENGMVYLWRGLRSNWHRVKYCRRWSCHCYPALDKKRKQPVSTLYSEWHNDRRIYIKRGWNYI